MGSTLDDGTHPQSDSHVPIVSLAPIPSHVERMYSIHGLYAEYRQPAGHDRNRNTIMSGEGVREKASIYQSWAQKGTLKSDATSPRIGSRVLPPAGSGEKERSTFSAGMHGRCLN